MYIDVRLSHRNKDYLLTFRSLSSNWLQSHIVKATTDNTFKDRFDKLKKGTP